MEAFKDFDAARAERQRVTPEFTLRGQRFRCYAAVPAGPMFDLIAAQTVDAYRSWLRACIRDDDEQTTVDDTTGDEVLVEGSSLDRFDALCYERGDDVVDEHDIKDLVDWLGEQYTGRPTGPSTDSSDGRSPNGDGSKRPSIVVVEGSSP